jgi:hypothetical protein
VSFETSVSTKRRYIQNIVAFLYRWKLSEHVFVRHWTDCHLRRSGYLSRAVYEVTFVSYLTALAYAEGHSSLRLHLSCSVTSCVQLCVVLSGIRTVFHVSASSSSKLHVVFGPGKHIFFYACCREGGVYPWFSNFYHKFDLHCSNNVLNRQRLVIYQLCRRFWHHTGA